MNGLVVTPAPHPTLPSHPTPNPHPQAEPPPERPAVVLAGVRAATSAMELITILEKTVSPGRTPGPGVGLR